MCDVLLLLSGGLDSCVLAHRAPERIGLCLFVAYGQPAEQQERAAAWGAAIALGLRIRELTLSLDGMSDMAARSGATGPRVVPQRNLVMCAHALNIAAAEGLSEVWYGATRDDWEAYADCRPGFVLGVDAAVSAPYLGAPNYRGPRVVAPLLRTRRAEVAAEARALGLLGAWSCYAPGPDGKPCGSCGSCTQEGI